MTIHKPTPYQRNALKRTDKLGILPQRTEHGWVCRVFNGDGKLVFQPADGTFYATDKEAFDVGIHWCQMAGKCFNCLA